jgi:phage terminase Nu1 subunit (DNA packaging protein)
MLGLSQQRVSQLVRAGAIVADHDAEGRLQYDRASVERYVAERAARLAPDPSIREERKLAQEEARERFARERKRREREEKERRELVISLAKRAVEALERLAKCGR